MTREFLVDHCLAAYGHELGMGNGEAVQVSVFVLESNSRNVLMTLMDVWTVRSRGDLDPNSHWNI